MHFEDSMWSVRADYLQWHSAAQVVCKVTASQHYTKDKDSSLYSYCAKENFQLCPKHRSSEIRMQSKKEHSQIPREKAQTAASQVDISQALQRETQLPPSQLEGD